MHLFHITYVAVSYGQRVRMHHLILWEVFHHRISHFWLNQVSADSKQAIATAPFSSRRYSDLSMGLTRQRLEAYLVSYMSVDLIYWAHCKMIRRLLDTWHVTPLNQITINPLNQLRFPSRRLFLIHIDFQSHDLDSWWLFLLTYCKAPSPVWFQTSSSHPTSLHGRSKHTHSIPIQDISTAITHASYDRLPLSLTIMAFVDHDYRTRHLLALPSGMPYKTPTTSSTPRSSPQPSKTSKAQQISYLKT